MAQQYQEHPPVGFYLYLPAVYYLSTEIPQANRGRSNHRYSKVICRSTGERSGSLIGEAMIDGEQRQFKAIGNAELVEDIADMVLDGLFADGTALGDIGIGVSGYDQ